MSFCTLVPHGLSWRYVNSTLRHTRMFISTKQVLLREFHARTYDVPNRSYNSEVGNELFFEGAFHGHVPLAATNNNRFIPSPSARTIETDPEKRRMPSAHTRGDALFFKQGALPACPACPSKHPKCKRGKRIPRAEKRGTGAFPIFGDTSPTLKTRARRPKFTSAAPSPYPAPTKLRETELRRTN